MADQGVTALTNIAVLVVAARPSTARDFAVFSLVYMTGTVLTGLAGGYVGQALVLVRGDDAARAGCRSAVAFTAYASCALGLAGAAVLFALPTRGDTTRALAVLGLVLPVLLGQDGLRYCFSALRRPHRALAADLVRLAVTVPALAVQPDGSGPARLAAVWGLSALPALLTGYALLAPLVRGARGSARALLRREHLGRRFAVEFAVGNGASQLAVIALGLVATPLAVGALRGASTLFGPMNVLCNATTSFGPPLLRGHDGHDGGGENDGNDGEAGAGPRRTVRRTGTLAVLLAGTAAAWASLLTVLPARVGRQLLGDTWHAASALLPATGSQYAGIALGTSALLTLRVLRPRATLPVQVVFSLASVVFLTCGYVLGGALGAAWGLCLGSALKAAALWLRVASVARGAPPPPAGTSAGTTPTTATPAITPTTATPTTVSKGGQRP